MSINNYNYNITGCTSGTVSCSLPSLHTFRLPPSPPDTTLPSGRHDTLSWSSWCPLLPHTPARPCVGCGECGEWGVRCGEGGVEGVGVGCKIGYRCVVLVWSIGARIFGVW